MVFNLGTAIRQCDISNGNGSAGGFLFYACGYRRVIYTVGWWDRYTAADSANLQLGI